MEVWSPQTQASDNPGQNCGGGVAPNILSAITGSLNGLLGGTLLSAIPLDQLVSVVPLASTPTPVPIPSAIYVRDNDGTLARPGVAASPPAPTGLFCLLGKTLGLYGTLDPDPTAVLGDALTNLSNLMAGCGKGKLYVDGAFHGHTTVGTDGDITIMSDLQYGTPGNLSHDGSTLGLVSTNGAVQVWTPLQCTLALSTCLSLNTDNVTPLKILGADIHVEAAIMSLQHTFGVSLPLLQPTAFLSLLGSPLLGGHIPNIDLYGSIAQYYRGALGANVLNLGVSLGSIDVASLNINAGYYANYTYDQHLRSSPPPNFPTQATPAWVQDTFAEIPVSKLPTNM